MVSQISTLAGRQHINHSRANSAEDFTSLQLSRVDFANTSEGSASYPRGRQTPGRRSSLVADDVLTSGFLENTIVAGQPNSNRSASRPLLRRSLSCATARSTSMAVEKVQRWSGMTRTVSDWDGLRRDSELWVEDGDCYVHLYAQGASRRGPSFCVPFRALRQKKCTSLLNVCRAQIASRDGSETQQLMNLSTSLTLPSCEPGVVNLFIPAPDYASREDAFKWHVTTRNFFAFLLGKPLVGQHMGRTFVDLQERIQLFRSGHLDNHHDFLQYAEDQGYRDFAECTDYALASLFYAEAYKLRPAWIDAFAHCVGMNESLSLSPEYAETSRLTKALITRAHLDVELHLNKVSAALGKFLEEDLSSTYLGLAPGARSHLNRFRRFLHGFYVKKFGYWPPPRGSTFSKALYKSMYYDFLNLYNYLVDTNSTTDFALQGLASGGICVLQNVDSFDKRHKFTPQPHPLPLLPNYAELSRKADSQKALRQLTLSSQHNKANNASTISAALVAATNTRDASVVGSNIVREYAHFERTYSSTLNQKDEKVTVVDARKARWLLIYGTLQYLVSALRAPKEVRDAETAEYPLCCLLPEQSSWPGSSQVSTPALASPAISALNVIDEYLNSSDADFTSIQPDCHREDYFSTRTASQRGSVDVPAPLKVTAPAASSPTRSFGSLSLSGRNSQRNSLMLKPASHCEILVHGYGNGLNEATIESPVPESTRSAFSGDSHRSSVSILPEGAHPETSWIRPQSPPIPRERTSSLNKTQRHTRQRTPLLDAAELARYYTFDLASDPTDSDMSRSDSTSSHHSQAWSESSIYSSSSSTYDDCLPDRHSTCVEDSGLLGGFVSVDSRHSPVGTAIPLAPTTISHMQAFRFTDDSVDQVIDESEPSDPTPPATDYTHIHPAFRPPHVFDTAIGVALSPTNSPLPSPSSLKRSSFIESPTAKTTTSTSTTTTVTTTPIIPARPSSSSLTKGLSYVDIPVTKLPRRSSSFRAPQGLFTTVSSSAKEAEKRASAERTKNRLSVLKRFYAF